MSVLIGSQVLPLAVPTRVAPPRDPADPVMAFLVDLDRTSSVVVQTGDAEMVSYVYGDWRYYALRQQGAWESVAAILWPTQGTLGRKEILGPATAEAIRAGMGVEIQDLYQFEVDRQAAERLQARLDRLFHDRLDTAVQAYGTTFVHHPQAYTYWTNSNHMTAGWLKELGCEVRGPAFSSYWRMRQQP